MLKNNYNWNNLGEIKLKYLQENYSHLPSQGSKDWLAQRKLCFGGSEMDRALESDTKRLTKFINDKTSNINKCPPRFGWWGHMFEMISKNYLFHRGFIIYEFGAIKSSNWPCAYSPDGVFINTKDDNDLWLLEIKCPIMRHVDESTKVAEKYIKQVQLGMHILPCDKTLFLQFKYRRCSIKNLTQPGNYNIWWHYETKRFIKQKERFWGICYWNTKNDKLKDLPIETSMPDKIWYSYDKENPTKKLFEHKTGNYMAFKCFYMKENTITKMKTFNQFNSTLWNNYGTFRKKYDKTLYPIKEESEKE